MDERKFKVWFKPKGQDLHICDSEDQWIDLDGVEETLNRILKGPSKHLMEKVWVVDGDDFTVLDWNHEKGLIFPDMSE